MNLVSLHQRALGAAALAQALVSCAVPASEVLPAPVAAPPSVAPQTPTPAATAGSPAPAPAPSPAVDNRLRLTGSVQRDGAPIPNARLALLDLATGAALAARPWTEARSLRLQGPAELRTDARGAFDLELAAIAPDQLVKAVATADGQTYVALLTASGETLEPAAAPADRYELAEAPSRRLTRHLTLTAASTAVAKAFEGVFKLLLQQAPAAPAGALGQALAAAQHAVKALQARLAGQPALAAALVASVGEDGELRDLDGFRAALSRAGAFEALFEAVRARLNALGAAPREARPGLAPVTAEDFPLDRVTISVQGSLAFTGQQAPVQLERGTFEPTPSRRRRASRPTPAPPAGPAFFRVIVGLPDQARGLAAYDDHTLVAAVNQTLWGFTTDPLSGEDYDPGFVGEDAHSVAVDQASGRVFLGRGIGLWSFSMPAPGGTRVAFGGYALATGRTHLYATIPNRIDRMPITDPNVRTPVQVNGGPYTTPGTDLYGLALEDTGASPTLYTGNEEGEVYSLQDGGATHTRLASGLGQIRGMAFSAPNRTLYLTSYDRREVYALQVDTRATATVTLDPPLSPNYHPWGVALSRDGATLSVTQYLPPPP